MLSSRPILPFSPLLVVMLLVMMLAMMLVMMLAMMHVMMLAMMLVTMLAINPPVQRIHLMLVRMQPEFVHPMNELFAAHLVPAVFLRMSVG